MDFTRQELRFAGRRSGKNNVKAETNPWTSWKILNGKLLLNKDTFAIDKLGSDSLMLENTQGIYVFKRQE